ncbi:MAG: F0F1 ATP synthase subunit epsilon [Desulfoprunum sp.]|jgi:F-type H+-transporting ATPase subunit epsilon|uniref:F0F1 ATP synthase subunit epsilon n=1 Tax=Desulfoprunum sp. TaxID=2020866 RepID=UPI003C783730
MHLKILLPFEIFAERSAVSRIVAETLQGSMGILPRRLDCVAALVPGILLFEDGDGGETYVAVDEGVLVKKGSQVLVSVRNAIGGDDLGLLREAIDREFRNLDDEARSVRQVLAKMESMFIRRFVRYQHG